MKRGAVTTMLVAGLLLGSCSSDKKATCSVPGEPAVGCDPLTAAQLCLDADTACACQFNVNDDPVTTSINVVECSEYCDLDSAYPVGVCNATLGCVCAPAPKPTPDGQILVSCGEHGSSDTSLRLDFGGEISSISCGISNLGKVAFRPATQNILDVADPLNAWLHTSMDVGVVTIAPGETKPVTVNVNRGYFDATGEYTGTLRFSAWAESAGTDPLRTIDVPVSVSAPLVLRVGETVYQNAYGERYVALLRRDGPAAVTVSLTFVGSGDMAFAIRDPTNWLSVAPTTGVGPTDLTLSVPYWSDESINSKYGAVETIDGIRYHGGYFVVTYVGGTKRVSVLAQQR